VPTSLRLATALLALTTIAACGGDGDDAPSGSSSTPSDATASATTAASASDAPTGDVVEILATGNLKFVPADVTAAVGQLFKGRLTLRGSIPHNLELKEFGISGEDTMLTKNGESKDFSFTPTKPGKFEFICTIHPGVMTGSVTVS